MPALTQAHQTQGLPSRTSSLPPAGSTACLSHTSQRLQAPALSEAAEQGQETTGESSLAAALGPISHLPPPFMIQRMPSWPSEMLPSSLSLQRQFESASVNSHHISLPTSKGGKVTEEEESNVAQL